jgi:ribosomal protein L14
MEGVTERLGVLVGVTVRLGVRVGVGDGVAVAFGATAHVLFTRTRRMEGSEQSHAPRV